MERLSDTAGPRPAEVMAEIYARYWPPTENHVLRTEIARHAAHLQLIRDRIPAGGAVVDLGCGWGAFAAGAAALGYRAAMLDDRGDAGFMDPGDPRQKLPSAYGVEAISLDLVSDPWPFPEDQLDAITSFDSMEHWHHSPRRALTAAVRSLKPGGWLILGVPNAANLKKRIEAVLGWTEWSSMNDWYETDRFRGHVREPTVRDLYYLARSLRLVDAEVLGYNWLGRANPSRVVAAVSTVVDVALRLRPSLCADIYLLARKPGQAGGPTNRAPG